MASFPVPLSKLASLPKHFSTGSRHEGELAIVQVAKKFNFDIRPRALKIVNYFFFPNFSIRFKILISILIADADSRSLQRASRRSVILLNSVTEFIAVVIKLRFHN